MRILILSLIVVLASCSHDATHDATNEDATYQPDASMQDASTQCSSFVAGGASITDWGAFDSDDSARLQSQIDLAVQNSGLPGLGVAVINGDGALWTGSSGHVDPDRTETWAPDRQFRIGSVTKTFTTAAVMQLVDEGCVDLDDPLEDWVPGYYDGLGVTVRHLLTNSSGIVSYNYIGSFDDSVPWTPNELVEWAVTHEPTLRFTPGSEWEYSNTNFVLLGLLIEAANGTSYADAIQTRLLDPLALNDTYVAGTGDTNPRIVACFGDDGTDLTQAADPSFGWAAGAMVSTPRDLARWAIALYSGDVTTPESLALMTTPTHVTEDQIEYGMGTFIEQDGTDALYGHTGGIAAYFTYMFYWKADKTAVIVMSNTRGANLRDLSAYAWSVPLDFEHP